MSLWWYWCEQATALPAIWKYSIQLWSQWLIMIINDYITDLCVYCTMLFIAILECALTHKKKMYCKAVCCVMIAAASHISRLPHLLLHQQSILSASLTQSRLVWAYCMIFSRRSDCPITHFSECFLSLGHAGLCINFISLFTIHIIYYISYKILLYYLQ